jgi:MFS family permease
MASEAQPASLADVPDAQSPSPARLARPFWMYLAASIVSWLGDGVLIVGFPLLAASLTLSPLWIAAMVFAQRLPQLLLAIPVGAMVDRMDARLTATWTNVAQAALLGGAALGMASGHFGLFDLFLVALLAESLATVFACASGALVPDVVPPEQFGQANRVMQAANMTTAYVVGPGVGGLLFTTARHWPLSLDALSFLLAALGLALLRTPHKEARPKTETHFVREVKDGVALLVRQPALRMIALTIAALAGFQTGSVAVVVLLGTQVVGLSKTGFGYALAAGNVVTPLMLLFLPRVLRLRTSQTVFGAILIAGIGELTMATATSGPQFSAGLALDALGVTTGSVALMTARMRLTPRDMFGRIAGSFHTILYAAIVVGSVVGGAAAKYSIRAPYFMCGAACLLLLLVVGPKLRTLDEEVVEPAAASLVGEAAEPAEV